ncbi:hypothetical protein PVAP13_5KG073400 [Panicum virgatum]|uniref:Uncharacterized protein n=1 Tax=Panicum virgatum TaxID=38727 RepID=A0A8T0SD91_PANVG|nr:hypothetical protein PVAP13_5KG073400 [Panicum virgatum]
MSAPRSSSLLALVLAALLLLASSPYSLEAYGGVPQVGGKYYGGRRSLGSLRESPPPPAPAGGPPIGPLPDIPAPPAPPGA